MIVEVIKDMSQFLIIFLSTLVAFAHVFFIFFKNFAYDDPKAEITSNPLANPMSALLWTYSMCIGDSSI